MMKNVAQYIAVALIAGCASVPPPTEQVALSKAAVANAVSAGAQEFAAPDLRSAQDKLERANLAMVAKDYESALWLAEHAQVDAELAGARSRAAKAEKSVQAVQEDSRVLREELNRKSK
jgi:predicted  nucleic acid-binding Zn-ribbon protein